MNRLQEQIVQLKKEKDAIILGHNYQRKEVQEISDFLGDSYGLSVQASKTKAKVIVFCGVDFMAESAKILNPEKTVLHPNLKAKCPMAAMVDVASLRELKAEHPGAPVVSYVNTSAEVKAESDICCTSANAVKIVQSLPDKKVIFVPDTNLGLYARRFVKDKELVLWPGYCHVHSEIRAEDIKAVKKDHPKAEVIAHPECLPEVIDIADAVASTEGMIGHIKQSKAKEFILATEQEMAYRLGKIFPDRRLIPLASALCPAMKKIEFEDVIKAIETLKPEVSLPKDVMERARVPLERMVAIGLGNKVDWN